MGEWTVQKVRDFLPDDLVKLLDFADKETYISVKPKSWLGRDTWRQINKLMKEADAGWVPAGKESEWQVPKEKGEVKGDERVRRIREAAERILKETEGMI